MEVAVNKPDRRLVLVVGHIGSGSLPDDHNHALPQIDYTTDARIGFDLKSTLFQQSAEHLADPKLDMPAVPQGGKVHIPVIAQCQGQVLEMAVVQGGVRETVPGAQRTACKPNKSPWVVEMFYALGANQHVN